MSLWSRFRGHPHQQEMFRRAIERGRLSQSYLFVGPDGIGKQLFARKLAQCLLCRESGDFLDACGACTGCRPFLAGNHPDFLFVERPEGKRELPVDLIAGSKEQRGQAGLCHDLSIRPVSGSRKIALINDADTMNEESANAFLKTLEEPPDRAVLFLIASNLDAVLPTIRSRCQLVRFAPLPISDIHDLLLEHEFVESEDDARFASSLSEGCLTTARQITNPELRNLRSALFTSLSQPSFSGLILSKSIQESLDKISNETPVQRTNCQWLIRFAVEYYRMALRSLSLGSSPGGAASIPESEAWANRMAGVADPFELIGSLIERCIQAASHLDQNISVGSCLDSLLDDLSKLSRPAQATR